MELWRDIQGYEGLYQVSNYGRVRSLERTIIDKNGRKMWFKGKILKYGKTKKGYLYVCLCNNGDTYCPYIHKLVAQEFIPNPNNYDVVHHIDHDPTNNRVENLVWMKSEQHYLEHMDERGEAVKESKSIPVYQYTLDRKYVREWESASEAAKTLGLSKSDISACCRGGFFSKTRNKWVNRTQAYNYIWSFVKLT